MQRGQSGVWVRKVFESRKAELARPMIAPGSNLRRLAAPSKEKPLLNDATPHFLITNSLLDLSSTFSELKEISKKFFSRKNDNPFHHFCFLEFRDFVNSISQMTCESICGYFLRKANVRQSSLQIVLRGTSLSKWCADYHEFYLYVALWKKRKLDFEKWEQTNKIFLNILLINVCHYFFYSNFAIFLLVYEQIMNHFFVRKLKEWICLTLI